MTSKDITVQEAGKVKNLSGDKKRQWMQFMARSIFLIQPGSEHPMPKALACYIELLEEAVKPVSAKQIVHKLNELGRMLGITIESDQFVSLSLLLARKICEKDLDRVFDRVAEEQSFKCLPTPAEIIKIAKEYSVPLQRQLIEARRMADKGVTPEEPRLRSLV
jgi:hypothetical protein